MGVGNIQVPENWEVMESNLIMRLAPYLLEDNNENFGAIFDIIIGQKQIKAWGRNRGKRLLKAKEALSWLFCEPIPRIDEPFFCDKEAFILPLFPLEAVTTDEYRWLDFYLKQYGMGNEGALSNLIATFCRRARVGDYMTVDWNGDHREKFNHYLVEKNAQIVPSFSREQIAYIFRYLVDSMKGIATYFPDLFTTGGGEAFFENKFEFSSQIYRQAVNGLDIKVVEAMSIHDYFGQQVQLLADENKRNELLEKAQNDRSF